MPSNRHVVQAPKAPKLNGNYSHAVRSGNTLHVSGCIGDEAGTGEIVSGGIQAQTVMLNLFICLVDQTDKTRIAQ